MLMLCIIHGEAEYHCQTKQQHLTKDDFEVHLLPLLMIYSPLAPWQITASFQRLCSIPVIVGKTKFSVWISTVSEEKET